MYCNVIFSWDLLRRLLFRLLPFLLLSSHLCWAKCACISLCWMIISELIPWWEYRILSGRAFMQISVPDRERRRRMGVEWRLYSSLCCKMCQVALLWHCSVTTPRLKPRPITPLPKSRNRILHSPPNTSDHAQREKNKP
ncbi:hypothetical protein B0J11DRAFT_258780 [Dendryphion nanum]|uniref:Uncharacterized protein n=1 Tax=Dendryphion nanum TaxID=256645 RepID=A0A9P9E4C8_9PLEO|nr:hypothetical protein B0J11DRAFT_258780 [Dendryphion nanum]